MWCHLRSRIHHQQPQPLPVRHKQVSETRPQRRIVQPQMRMMVASPPRRVRAPTRHEHRRRGLRRLTHQRHLPESAQRHRRNLRPVRDMPRLHPPGTAKPTVGGIALVLIREQLQRQRRELAIIHPATPPPITASRPLDQRPDPPIQIRRPHRRTPITRLSHNAHPPQ